ncbi:uncharacterized protein PFL1_01024 [Pseudozyma flocculosa PF-1]|uniref:Related to TGL5 - triacylglycerol lipase n=1 Tax=Pseudozyma flocculosa TaxID=84751 RepID=A0A5C3F8P3_9BASI|nr:uncharacterized protein PFL1_01024 [Pseudozyma flocculosa PF-1]EPQ31691.1 hypothetical protein PFL1_01024 [Pseudozyma flocculosa PF-1]SPO40808.1 related to TGL5 - triacylglycerol lipase [Pseudozyma flocculosa]
MASLFHRRRAAHPSPAADTASDPAATPRRRRSSAFNLLSPRSEAAEPELDPLLTAQYAIPDHVEAFREALSHDLGQSEYLPASAAAASQITGSSTWSMLGFPNGLKSPGAKSPVDTPSNHFDSIASVQESASSSANPAEPSSTQASNPRKVGRIAAASDFAPIREKVHRKKKRRSVDSGTREGFVYHTLRWPLLIGIFLTIFLEFAAYVIIRQIVNVIEYAIAWRGKKGELRKRMRKSTTLGEWKEAALELDEFMGFEAWKTDDASGFYDWILVKKVKASLKAFREKEDTENLLGVLDLCLRNNFAGTENFRLYSETFFGTKYLVESYLSELELALRYVESTDKITPEVKRQFYRTVSRNLGRSALCLSGGASFGYYHIGVVRALLDSNLLPKVVTGTSAGGLIAALTCTRTDEELKKLLVPALADRITACEEPISVWARRAWHTGARFDTVSWAEKCAFFTLGSMTFKEAYERTGKVLCISVIPSDRHSPVKLLNYITAPDCVIWSSLLASAAVPGILNPVCLMQKTRDGRIIPWNWGHRFKDGSLRVDIPLQDLHALFNVNYPIVSQVNPHVHLFHFGSKGAPGRPTAHRKGKGWRGGFVLSAAEHVLKLHLKMNFKIIRDLDLLPAILGQDWSSVFLQPFGGAVTIWPKTRAWDWVRILTDPDRKELSRMIDVGQIVTFPKIHMVENRIRLEKAIERGRKKCRRAIRSAEAEAAGNGNGNGSSVARRTRRNGGENGSKEPLPTAGSVSEGTDNDDFFSSKTVGNGFTSFSAAGKASTSRGRDNDEGEVLHPNGLDSNVGTPGIDAESDSTRQQPAPQRPKPYPTYSRYLFDTRAANKGRATDLDSAISTPRGDDDDNAGATPETWLDRGQGDIEQDEPRTSGEVEGAGGPAEWDEEKERIEYRKKRSARWGDGTSWDDRSYDTRKDEDRFSESSVESSEDDNDEDDDEEGQGGAPRDAA